MADMKLLQGWMGEGGEGEGKAWRGEGGTPRLSAPAMAQRRLLPLRPALSCTATACPERGFVGREGEGLGSPDGVLGGKADHQR